MNKVITVLVLIAIGFGAYYFMRNVQDAGPIQSDQQANNQQQGNNNQNNQTSDQDVPEKAEAVVETSMGSFTVTLDGKAAPKTVANFIKLSKDGFYENLTFHRIEKTPGFRLIQGGDPNGDGTGGPGYTVPAEIGLKHTKGAIAMARTGDQVNPLKASSGSQFYIVLHDIPQLDGNYTVFGYVTAGMDVVEKIGNVQTITDDTSGRVIPIEDIVIKKITIKE
jgi:peptidyl-prolyl cis-trans isomerase B (cyclophilin B)